MKKYILSTDQLSEILNTTIDQFMSYQFREGFEEPRARQEAIMDVLDLVGRKFTGTNRPED